MLSRLLGDDISLKVEVHVVKDLMKAKLEFFNAIDCVELMRDPVIRYIVHQGLVDVYVVDRRGTLTCKFYSTTVENLPVREFDKIGHCGFIEVDIFVNMGSERVL